MSLVSDSELIGKQVVSQDGREVGKITEIYVDVLQWQVPAIGVQLRKEVLDDLHLKRPWIGSQAIRIPTSEVSGATDTVVLKVALTELSFIGGKPEADQALDEGDGEGA